MSTIAATPVRVVRVLGEGDVESDIHPVTDVITYAEAMDYLRQLRHPDLYDVIDANTGLFCSWAI